MAIPGTSRRWLLLAAVALAAPAQADGPCDGDIQKLCKDVPVGDGRVLACLQANSSALSDSCRAMMDQARQAAYDLGLSCQADVFSWCQGIAPGQGRLVACLLSHRSDLSSTCQEAITSVKDLQSACGGDLAQMCSGVPAGGGQRLACLFAQKDQLSEGCRSFLEQGR